MILKITRVRYDGNESISVIQFCVIAYPPEGLEGWRRASPHYDDPRVKTTNLLIYSVFHDFPSVRLKLKGGNA